MKNINELIKSTYFEKCQIYLNINVHIRMFIHLSIYPGHHFPICGRDIREIEDRLNLWRNNWWEISGGY